MRHHVGKAPRNVPAFHDDLAVFAAEVWGQLFFQHAQPDDVAERLWASGPTVGGAGPGGAAVARPSEGLAVVR